jgi:hypothetical protein
MRKGSARTVIAFLVWFGWAKAADAQQPADSIVADSAAASDSLSEQPGDIDEDTTLRRQPGQAEQGSSPYLREVHPRGNPFWASLSTGAGSQAWRIAAPGQRYGPAVAGLTLGLESGIRLGHLVRVGLEAFNWFGGGNGNTIEALNALLFVGRLYPLGRSGPFLKGGAGLSVYGVYDFAYDEYNVTAAGLGYMVGAGWEVPVSSALSLSPIVELHDADFGGLHQHVLNFGLMVTWANVPTHASDFVESYSSGD